MSKSLARVKTIGAVKRNQGYVLMIVAVALVVIATLSLSLFANTSEHTQQLQSRYELQQLQYALATGIEHTKAQLLSSTSCSGYGGLTHTLPGATYSTNLNATSGSPIKATITATHLSGLERQATISVNMYQPASSLTLVSTADTYLNEDKVSDNYGDKKEMHSQAKDDDKDERPLVRFDLSTVPTPSIITQATLQMELKGTDNDNDPDNIYRIARSWEEDEATWNKYETGILTFWLEAGGQHQYHRWGRFPDSIEGTQTADITALVRLWQGGLANYGMLLHSDFDGNDSHKHYYSRDDDNADNHPQLIVNYRCECGSTC